MLFGEHINKDNMIQTAHVSIYNGNGLTNLLISFFTEYKDLQSLMHDGVTFQIREASLTNVDSINFDLPTSFRFIESTDLNVQPVD